MRPLNLIGALFEPEEKHGFIYLVDRAKDVIISVKEGTTLTEDQVNEFCLDLPRYKRPRKIIFADVPRNPMEKIEKPKHRKMYGAADLIAQRNGTTA